MTVAAATVAYGSKLQLQAGVATGVVAGLLLSLFAFDNLLLLHFWSLPLPVTALIAAVCGAAVMWIGYRSSGCLPAVPYQVLAGSFAAALALLALGGEGRFFYANVDWQIRDAVLHDMATNPWPLAYQLEGATYFLRAPIGMYLLPALFGENADGALLLLNSLRLSLILSLAWHLFATTRERAIGLAVFLLISGWDVVGTALRTAFGAHLNWNHLEAWNDGFQYSSHVTQAFWAPQHAIAGWTCAVAFLLWRKGLASVGLFAATIPLVALWSPLAVMGAVPFAMLAAVVVMRRWSFTSGDVAAATIALGIALPALLYLRIGASDVGIHLRLTYWWVLPLCALCEVLPFVLPLILERARPEKDEGVIQLLLILLLLMPLVQIGVGSDFQMRGAVMPWAVLAFAFAGWVTRVFAREQIGRAVAAYALVALALGAVTPALEARRAIVNRPSPPPLCSLAEVWFKQDNLIGPYTTYLAPVAALPMQLRSTPVVLPRADHPRCWSRRWDRAD